MRQAQFNTDYKTTYPNWKVYTLTDRRQYYNDMIEQYRQNGQITDKQARTWGHPPFLTRHRQHICAGKY